MKASILILSRGKKYPRHPVSVKNLNQQHTIDKLKREKLWKNCKKLQSKLARKMNSISEYNRRSCSHMTQYLEEYPVKLLSTGRKNSTLHLTLISYQTRLRSTFLQKANKHGYLSTILTISPLTTLLIKPGFKEKLMKTDISEN